MKYYLLFKVLTRMPIEPEQLKRLRKSLGLTQADAAESVRVERQTWISWERDADKPTSRTIPDGLLELFCIKHKIKYKVLDKKVYIVYH
jgi:DNA-binding XRE family transcriptional regulator